jgi:hypothetical protein
VTGRFAAAAEDLRLQETTRLAAGIVPTLATLRFHSPIQLRACVASMLERLGYELLTPEMATDLLALKDAKKYLVAFASTSDPLPVQANLLTRLHQAIVTQNAASGFCVTTRGFSRDAEAYAKTAPIKLVDGPKLVASIKRSMEKLPAIDTYRAMCRQCGEIVTHRLDRAEAVTCRNGHTIPPTIAQAALAVRVQADGSTSRTYSPPRVYPRREVNAHNAKYAARMRKRKPAAPQESAAENDAGNDPFAVG